MNERFIKAEAVMRSLTLRSVHSLLTTIHWCFVREW